jgi:hypothetical protein
MQHAAEPDGSQRQRQRNRFAEDRRARAAVGDIDQGALAQCDSFELGAIGLKSLLGIGTALDEIEERAGHLAGSCLPQVFDARHSFHGQAHHCSRGFRAVRMLSLIPSWTAALQQNA